jgi:DNA modification methylase
VRWTSRAALRRCCKRLSSWGSYLVFDPFAGRGTVGRAALLHERYYFLTEKEPAYFEYAQKVITERSLLCPDYPPRFLSYEEFRDAVCA